MVKISILLPVYNAEYTIKDAINSLLNQTFKDFEIIIINDGSTDQSETYIQSYRDKRIKYFTNKTNKGLIYTLNRGISLCQGKYIARMDADDISLPTRLEKQYNFMENNPNVIVCGTKIKYFGSIKRFWIHPFISYLGNIENKSRLIYTTCFAHPTVIIRKDILIKNNLQYNTNYKNAEDYKLWIDMVSLGDFCNLPDILLKYRLSATQTTQKSNKIQLENSRLCRQEILEKMYNIHIIQPINIQTLQEYKNTTIPFLLQTIYLSLDKYDLKTFFFFIRSLHWRKFNLWTNLSIIKRFVTGPLIPLI